MTEFVLLLIIAFASIVFLISLISPRLEGTLVTAPMVFVAAGLLLSPAGLDWIDPGPAMTRKRPYLYFQCHRSIHNNSTCCRVHSLSFL